MANPSRDLDNLSQLHYLSLKTILIRRINRIKKYSWLKLYLLHNVEKIIKSKPVDLYKINKEFNTLSLTKKTKTITILNLLRKVFDYESFIRDKNKSYSFAQRLQVNCCPYCNRNYTVTVITKNNSTIIRPDFDHFFPKSKYPLLALSFFNLIPSCPLCNRSVKQDQDLVYKKYIHPYEEGFDTILKFNYKALDTDSALGVKKNIKIVPLIDNSDIKRAKRCENSYKLFKLNDIYEISHTDEIADLIRTYHVSGGRYLEVLHNNFSGLGTLHELYKIAFGKYMDNFDFEKRPLSKLTKDVVEQLNFYAPISP